MNLLKKIASRIHNLRQEPTMYGRDALIKHRDDTLLAEKIEDIFNSVLHADPVNPADIAWSFDGGDLLTTARMLPSAMWTAYAAYAAALWREGNYWDKRSTLACERWVKAEIDEMFGFNQEAHEVRTSEECEKAAKAVYFFATMFALDRSTDKDFRWLLSMTTEHGTANVIVDFDEWCKARAADSTNEHAAEAYRWLQAAHESWFIPSGGLNDFPDRAEIEPIIRHWLTEDCDDKVHTTRHERIVDRCSDRVYTNLVLEMAAGDCRRLRQDTMCWELILASGQRGMEVTSFLDSREYKLTVLEKKVRQLEEATLLKKEKEALDERIAQASARLEELLGTSNDKDVHPGQASSSKSISNLPGISNRRSAFDLSHR